MRKNRVEKVALYKRDRTKVEQFADARCGENQDVYRSRGGFKREDIVVGALAEIAVARYLRKNGFKVNLPDFKIYKRGKKSFNADLTDGERHFHVKGQSLSSAYRYGNSWLMQRYDPLVKEPTRMHYIVPCEVDTRNNTVTIFGVISFTALHYHHCFMDCKVPQFNKTKTAIYLDALNNISNTARWGLINKGTLTRDK